MKLTYFNPLFILPQADPTHSSKIKYKNKQIFECGNSLYFYFAQNYSIYNNSI